MGEEAEGVGPRMGYDGLHDHLRPRPRRVGACIGPE